MHIARIVTLGLALVLMSSTLASAQATRTWVSGVGDDVNPCSRTAPCKTWAGAISKTAANGEINALDPGAFGALTLTKSMTILNEAGIAGTLATLGSSGFIINAPGIHVVLRGLDINGAGTGLSGIRFIQGASLTVENCRIYGFQRGIDASNAVASSMFVKDTVITGTSTNGILITGPVDTMLTNVRIERGAGPALRAENGEVTIRNSVVAGNASGIAAIAAGLVNIDNTMVFANTGIGVRAAGGTVRIGNSTVIGNGTGLSTGAGAVISLGNNSVTGNGVDGVFDSTVPRL